MIEPFVLVCQTLLVIHKLDAFRNVSLIPIARLIKRVSMRVVKIHAKHLHAESMLSVVFTIILPIVIAVMVLWVMHSFIVCQFLRLEIKQLTLALNHLVYREVFAMFTEMLPSVIHVQMKMVTIIPAVAQIACQTVIVNLIKRV